MEVGVGIDVLILLWKVELILNFNLVMAVGIDVLI